MSGHSGGIVRRRYRFVEWTLKAMSAMAVRYVGTCLSCGERSVDTDDPDDAQLWCLRHAGATGDSAYELSAFRYYEATMSNATNGAPPLP